MSGGIHSREARGPEGMRIYAIGDIHGRLDLLAEMHALIGAEIARDRPADWRIIHLGDYIDRGPDSQGVIDFLIAAGERDRRVLSLGGNHDAGLVDFLARPSADCLFVLYGGVATARSYGVAFDADRLGRFHGDLAAALPARHLDFVARRPLSASFGDFFFCHAGVRPGVALDRQDPQDLIWIREGFLDHAGLLDKVVVHGHTIAAEPEVLACRINVDTGAYRSNRLTALRIDGADKGFLTAGA